MLPTGVTNAIWKCPPAMSLSTNVVRRIGSRNYYARLKRTRLDPLVQTVLFQRTFESLRPIFPRTTKAINLVVELVSCNSNLIISTFMLLSASIR